MNKTMIARLLAFFFLSFMGCTYVFSQNWQLVNPKYPTTDAFVAGFVVDVDTYGKGDVDVTKHLQGLIDQLDNCSGDPKHGGGVVYLPEGNYRIDGTLILRKGITLRGDWKKPVKGQPIQGTILEIRSGKGNEGGTPFIMMESASAVMDLNFWYPEQQPNNITPYPPAIQFGRPGIHGDEFCNAKNITLVNAYSGIYFYQGGGTCPTINGVYGTPLKQGVEIDRIVDIGRVEWCDFSPAYWEGSGLPNAPTGTNVALRQWLRENGTGVVMRRNDWSYTCYLTVDGYNKGFHALQSKGDTSTPNGHNYGFNLTNCKYGLYFEGRQGEGCMFTDIKIQNCEYGVYLSDASAGVLQLYKWKIDASNYALFSDKKSSTRIAMQESEIKRGKVRLQGGTLTALDNDFNNEKPQIQFEANARGNITGNRFAKGVEIVENSIFKNQINHEPVEVKKLPEYTEVKPLVKKPSRHEMYNVMNFGVEKGTRNKIPAADATKGIQEALDKASQEGGGIVYLPPGHYRINGSLSIPANVELKGSIDVSAFPLGPGSVFEVYNQTTPAVQMKANSGLRGVVFNYPEQEICVVMPNPIEFPFAIQMQGDNAYIVNVGMRAAYRGVDLSSFSCSNFYIDFLTGYFFKEGINIKNSTNGILSNMQCNTIVYNSGGEVEKFGGWPNSNKTACEGELNNDGPKSPYLYNSKNLDFLTMENVKDVLLYNNFNYNALNGIVFKDNVNGLALGFALDDDRTTILVDGTNVNFDFINLQDVALHRGTAADGKSSYIKTTANFQTGAINIFSSDYWGRASSSGIVMDGAGTITLNMANFMHSGVESFARVNNGRLDINCSVVNAPEGSSPLYTRTSGLKGIYTNGSLLDPAGTNVNNTGVWNNNMGAGYQASEESAISREGWVATASFSSDGSNPTQGIDGNAGSRWTSGWQNQNTGQGAVWYQIDMGKTEKINQIMLEYANSPSDGPQTYTLEVSEDGEEWEQVASGNGSNQLTIISFKTVEVRYFKITKPASTKANFWAIHELYAFYTGIDEGGSGEIIPPIKDTYMHSDGVPGGGAQDTGNHIGEMHLTGAYIEFPNVDGGTGGKANICIQYASNDNSQMGVSANGGLSESVALPSTGGWENYIGNECVVLTLKAGKNNTIRVSHIALAANIRSITVEHSGTIEGEEPEVVEYPMTLPMKNPLFTDFPSPLFGKQGTGPLYTADASAHVWADGRLYVYASHDMDPANGCDRMDKYHVFSTDDMIYWTDHGQIVEAADVPWQKEPLDDGATFMWAPDCAYKDGKYYFYFPHPDKNPWNSNWKIGVAVSDNPASGFEILPQPLIGLPSSGEIDPCVYVDDDGQAYFYYGGGGKSFGARLKDNMIELDGALEQMTGLVDFHEATWIHKYNGKYYLSYSDNHGSDGNQMKYAMSDHPLGPWTDMGVYMYGTGTDTNHGSIVEYKGQWYAFYHTSNYSGRYNLRSVCVDLLYHNPDGTIQVVQNFGTPYGGAARRVIATSNVSDIALTLEAEDFNAGGNHYAYYDKDETNKGGHNYRPGESVDIETKDEAIYISSIEGGEWIRYSIYVEKAGLYDIDCIVASGQGGGRFHLSINGTNKTGDISVPNRGWNTWQTITTKNVLLLAGEQYLDMRANGGYNVDKFIFRISEPYPGTPYKVHNVPGTFQAEDFDNGGQGVAYFDNTPTSNDGGYNYRNATDGVGVDIENSAGSIHISHTGGGEWVKYTFNVLESGIYDISMPVATGNGNVSLWLSFDDVDIYPTVSIDTKGWGNYLKLTVPDVTLIKGTHVMTLNLGGGINVDKFEFVKKSDTSIDEVTANLISAYPNPTDGVFRINMPEKGNVKISNISGSLVYEKALNESVNSIDLSRYPSGIYIVTVTFGNKTQHIKLIKQ